MRFLVDANVSIRIVARLRAEGHDVVSVYEKDHDASDEIILRRATKEGRIVITYDKDFGSLVFEKGLSHCGVILLRAKDETHGSHTKLIDEFLKQHSETDIKNVFWVLSDSGHRRAA